MKYVDNVGNISYEEFLGLPSSLLEFVMTIRTAEAIKNTKLDLLDTKDEKVRKKLNETLNKLEAFFNG